MKTKIILFLALCFLIAAAAAEAATLAPEVTTFEIKPIKNFVVGDTGYLSLHVVSNTGPINVAINITLTEGSTNVVSINQAATTGSCTLFTCTYDGLWPFTINSLPVTYRAVVTDIATGTNVTLNATTKIDNDGDGYYVPQDCDDTRASVHPGATEVCGNGLDDDCSGGDASCGGSTGGHTSGGGGGGSTSGRLSAGDFNCTGLINNIITNDKIKVTMKGTEYTFFVKSLSGTTLGLKLYPIPSRDFAVAQGEIKYIDLDRDNMNDLSFKVLEVKSGTAKAECNLIEQRIPPTKPKETVTKKIEEKVQEVVEPVVSNIREGILRIAGEAVPKEGPSPVIGSIIVLAIVIGGLVGYYILRRGRDEEDFS